MCLKLKKSDTLDIFWTCIARACTCSGSGVSELSPYLIVFGGPSVYLKLKVLILWISFGLVLLAVTLAAALVVPN